MSPYPPQLKKNKTVMKRSVWLPLILTLYLLGMTGWFAPTLIRNGEITRLVSVFLIECMVIIILHIFLKKREHRGKP